MTPVDEAVERVRAFLDKNTDFADRTFIDELMEEGAELTLGDLRALLSALELGSVASEAWRPIEGWGGRFLVSSMGRVKGPRGFMKGLPDRDGYPRVTLTLDGAKRTHSIHSLVAGAFLGPRPEGHDIDHIDKDRGNARLSNLRYVTHGENMEGVSSGLAGEGHPRAKLTEAQVSEIRASSETPSNLAARYGVSKGAICDIRSGRRWPVVTADEPATPSDLDALGRAMLNLNADRIAWRKGNPRPALLTLRDMDAIWAALSASTTDSGSVDHYRDDTALKFPTGEGGGL